MCCLKAQAQAPVHPCIANECSLCSMQTAHAEVIALKQQAGLLCNDWDQLKRLNSCVACADHTGDFANDGRNAIEQDEAAVQSDSHAGSCSLMVWY